jgi:hypothetical protein
VVVLGRAATRRIARAVASNRGKSADPDGCLPLARAQAAYRDGTARLAPASADRLARRVEHFASSVQFVLDDPDAARRLHALTKDLRTVPRLGTLLPQVLRGAMALVGGDFGNIQIVDPATGSLRLVTCPGCGSLTRWRSTRWPWRWSCCAWTRCSRAQRPRRHQGHHYLHHQLTQLTAP